MAGNPLFNMLYGNPLANGLQGGQQSPGGLVGALMGGGSQGQPPGPPGGQGQPPAPQMAQAQATQSPPDLTRLYLQLEQRDRSEDMFNTGMANIVASRTPPGMQGGIRTPGVGPGAGAELQNLMGLQNYGLQQQAFGQLLQPGPDGMAPIDRMAQQSGIDPAMLRSAVRLDPTILSKIVEQGAGVGGSPAQQDFFRDWTKARAANPGVPNAQLIQKYPQLANAEGYAKIVGDAAAAKPAATESFGSLDPKLATYEDNAKWLADPANQAALDQAIKHPAWTNMAAIGDSLLGSNISSADVAKARSKLDWMKNQFYTEEFQGTKNVRTQREAQTLQGSVSNIDDYRLAPADIAAESMRIYQQAQATRANLMASAGKQLPARYAGLADQSFTNSDTLNPYYNGATQEAPKALPQETLTAAQAEAKADPAHRNYLVQHFRDLGYDTSGF